MNGTMRYRKAAFLLCGLLVAMPQIAIAEGSNSATLTVKVTVFESPCVINDNQPIKVEFYDVMTTRVDGRNYRTRVEYSLECPSYTPNPMKLQVVGFGASFDGAVLRTQQQDGLGIEFQQGTTKLPINTWLNFTYPNKPELWAVPVKQRGVPLTGGEFTASATMKVEYQ